MWWQRRGPKLTRSCRLASQNPRIPGSCLALLRGCRRTNHVSANGLCTDRILTDPSTRPTAFAPPDCADSCRMLTGHLPWPGACAKKRAGGSVWGIFQGQVSRASEAPRELRDVYVSELKVGSCPPKVVESLFQPVPAFQQVLQCIHYRYKDAANMMSRLIISAALMNFSSKSVSPIALAAEASWRISSSNRRTDRMMLPSKMSVILQISENLAPWHQA